MKDIYNRRKAVEYAHEWAYDRNPQFYDFKGVGGDCTNFVSQCLYFGGAPMNFTKIFGWYYINLAQRSASWTSARYFYNFLLSESDYGPYGHLAGYKEMEAGDVVILKTYTSQYPTHSVIVVETSGKNPDGILVAAHSFDSDYRKLSSYNSVEKFYIKIGAKV